MAYQYVRQAKLLGINLDTGLTSECHVKYVIKVVLMFNTKQFIFLIQCDIYNQSFNTICYHTILLSMLHNLVAGRWSPMAFKI
ncbi:hypothetical protein BpHYR1_040765 [Brachionus plicatilis]|uniref:Uncharacterized protein n=1 Tax=Brachionus plicatilis TaxID=10195 RepID=A0A3M7PRM8_BRAPC|nr:hypothetical protein BpHYR1_040765 [Brachionus plicatilis]